MGRSRKDSSSRPSASWSAHPASWPPIPGKAATIEAGVARLLAPSGMGTRFCALGVRSKDVAPLPGFEPVDITRSAP